MAAGHDIQYFFMVTAFAERLYSPDAVSRGQMPVALSFVDFFIVDIGSRKFLTEKDSQHLVKTIASGFHIEFHKTVALVHGNDDILDASLHGDKLRLLDGKIIQLGENQQKALSSSLYCS